MKATVKYYCTARVRKDGLSPLIASIFVGGRRTRTGALLFCERAKFDVSRQAFKPSAKVLQGAAPLDVKEANLRLLQASVEVARLAAELRDAPPAEEMVERLEETFRVGRRKGSATLADIVDEMVEEYKRDGKAINMYETLAKGLRTYSEYKGAPQTAANFEARQFFVFLTNAREIEERTGVFKRTGRARPRNATRGGLHATAAFLRVVSAWAVRRGKIAKGFMDNVETPGAAAREPLCLTPADMDRLQSANLEGKVRDWRDMFLLQCSLGCRHSDLKKLTDGHVHAGVFEYIPAKTGKMNRRVVSVPINRRAARILADNPGVLDRLQTADLRQYNEGIRLAAQQAGLDRPVCTYVKDEEQTVPLWSLLSSHAARRTFISTLLNAGVQERVIKDMDGHAADSKAFSRYYTIERSTKEQAVKVLE